MFWTRNQDFVTSIVEEWDLPKLIIRNEHYKWDEYRNRIINFLGELKEDADIL